MAESGAGGIAGVGTLAASGRTPSARQGASEAIRGDLTVETSTKEIKIYETGLVRTKMGRGRALIVDLKPTYLGVLTQMMSKWQK